MNPLLKRVLVVASSLWAIFVFVIVLNLNINLSGHLRPIGFITGFTIFGIFPIAAAWGVAWIVAAKNK